MDLFDFDQRLQAVLRDMPEAFRTRLLHVLTLPDDDEPGPSASCIRRAG